MLMTPRARDADWALSHQLLLKLPKKVLSNRKDLLLYAIG